MNCTPEERGMPHRDLAAMPSRSLKQGHTLVLCIGLTPYDFKAILASI